MPESSFPDVRFPRLRPADLLPRLGTATERFADLVVHGDLEAPVPACPDWRFADLIAHLGVIHQWATHAVVAGNPQAEPIPAPSTRPALVDWYRHAAETLVAALRATDPEAPVWAFGPAPHKASFWIRRQTHESTMHLWDAETAQGVAQPIDDDLARDGIDEVAALFFPRQVRLGRIRPLERALAVSVTGSSGTGAPDHWILAGDGTGPVAEVSIVSTITGPAEALLLLLWGRLGLDDARLAVSGDRAAAGELLSSALTP